MKLSRRLFLFALPGLPSIGRAQSAVTVEGQVFEGSVKLLGSRLVLNGTGVRAVAWFKGYAAGLYLTARATSVAQIEATPGPKRLQMRMLWGVPAVEFSKALRKGVSRNCTPEQFSGLSERMERFARQIDAAGEVRNGDVIDLDFDPSKGLLFSINGRLQGDPIPGADLYAALLRAFVGERPYDKRLRAGLLGAP